MKIYAPNIHLFAFQLYKGSNVEPAVPANEIQLWQSADEIVRTTLQQDLALSQRLDITKEPENPRVELLKDSFVKDGDYSVTFQGNVSLDNAQKLIIKGFASPLRIYDSYGLWLNLRRPEKEDDGTYTEDLDIALLSKFNQNNCLTLNQSKLFIGQTLLITTWLTGAKDKINLNHIAEECLKSVFPDASQRPPFNRQGELFGSPIFEYGLFSQPAKYQHVLMWLFADEQADNKFNECYQDLLDLFFFRAKAVKAFQDSREIYRGLALGYAEIEKVIDNLPKNNDGESWKTADLKDLKNQLKALPQLSVNYTRLLRSLEEYQNTISINSDNYSSKLRKISSIIGDDLSFLRSFSEESSPFFQKQITSDLGYFKHGSTLLEQAISSIRGIVEIEQAEQDRSLENTIQVVGVGLGAGAIASGVITQQINYINKPLGAISFKNPPHPFYASLFLSILVTLFFGLLAWLWTKRK